MVPIGSVATFKDETAPYRVPRYNLYPAAEIMGAAAPGVASGTALERMAELAKQVLPSGITFEWTDLSHQQEQQSIPTLAIFAASAVFVFLVLAAQYESAGSEMRQSFGTAVLFGMLGVTGFGLVFTPAFYALIRKLGTRRRA
jgi:multidrug efflux pump subunit AcrB